jgi:hypothetical protein
MEGEDERRFLSIQRCDTFLRAQQFPGTAIKAAAKRLAAVRAELDALMARERAAKGMLPWDGKEIRKRSRDLRKGYLLPISRAAKAIDGFVAHTPGAAAVLKVPHLTDSAALHVEAGDRVAEFMKGHRAAFLKETGFDRNLLSKLRAATNELRRQSAFAHKTRNERSALLRDIKAGLRKGRTQIDLLKSLLEPFLIERKLNRVWEIESRVGPKLGRPRNTPDQRNEKRIQNARRKKERLEAQRLRREQLKEARRARKLLQEQQRKQKQSRKEQLKREQPPVAPPLVAAPPVAHAPVEQPLTKAVFVERLAEQGGEVER